MRNCYRHPFLVLLNFVASLCAAIAVGLIFRDAGEQGVQAVQGSRLGRGAGCAERSGSPGMRGL